jgi:hypothetical protein
LKIIDFPRTSFIFFSHFPSHCSLSEIFGAGGDENKPTKSLRYQPPKPTYPGTDESPESKQQWVVLTAKIASAYKVQGKLNVPQGKTGFALLKSPEELKMILYRDKQNVLSSTMILEKFTIFTKDSYLQYQDDNAGLWSVIFETRQDFDEVIKLLEPRCVIQRSEEKPKREEQGDLDEIRVEKNDTDPEDKQNKQFKANILTRMAKMGKKIVLPKMAPNSEISDSSDTEMKGEGSKVKPALPPRKQHARAPMSGQLQIAQMAPGAIPRQVGPVSTYSEPNHIIPQGPGLATFTLSNATESNLNLMISENRIQSTELRFNLTKLDNKVDKILDKIDLLSTGTTRNNNNCLNRDEEIIELEEKILNLKKENLNLKCRNRDLEGQCTTSPKKAVLEDQEALKAENETLKKQNQDISVELIEKVEEVKKLQQELREKLELLETKEQHLNAKNSQLENSIQELEEFREKLKVEENLNETLRREIEETPGNLEPRNVLENSSQTEENPEVSVEIIKELMNNLYFKLCDKISNLNESELKQSEILKNIGQTIKQETNEVLRNLQ